MTGALLLLAAAGTDAASIQSLRWMIGDWVFHDVATEAAGFRYEERGTRSCRWSLEDQYIRCQSAGGSEAQPRSYVVYINYNAAAQRFEMVSLWSNHPPKVVHYGQWRDGALLLRSAHPEVGQDGVARRAWAVLRPTNGSTWTWETGFQVEGSAEDGPIKFRDVATRLPNG